MNYSIDESGEAAVLRLRECERVSSGDINELNWILAKLVTGQKYRRVLVDLSAASTLNIETIHTLSEVSTAAKQSGTLFSLAGPKPSVVSLLYAAGLTSRILIYPMVPDGALLEALGSRGITDMPLSESPRKSDS